MERRLLLAVVLSFVVVFASNFFMTKNVKQSAIENSVATQKLAGDATTSSPIEESSGEAKSGYEVAAQASAILPPAEELKEITVKTKLYEAVFTNFGARLKSFELNDYKITQEADSPRIDMVTVDALNQLPLAVHLSTTENLQLLTGNELFSVDSDSIDLVNDPSGNKLVFSFMTKDNIRIEKVLTFDNDTYNIDLAVKIANRTNKVMAGKMNINWHEHFTVNKDDRAAILETFAFYSKDVDRNDNSDLEDNEMLVKGDIKWSGFSTKFFMVAFVPELYEKTSFYAGKPIDDVYHIRATSDKVIVDSGASVTLNHKIYIGPKRSELLEPYGVGLQGAINYGFFSVISIPLMWLLKLFYSFTHNYGIAIILLTILIKIVFFPLTQKSYKAMKDMQKISPLLTELKEKFKDDKERLNKEVLALYKKHRVNPVGGCFPMLLQMPVFLALYKALMISVELRHAPFFFWITDLSSKDPYYVTPIVMGVTMLLQQKMSPSTGDKMQQRMMLIMPVVFTFMFLNFASGLVIYWLMNNVLSIIQQGFVLKKDD